MEILILILLVSLLFPGSSDGGAFEFILILVFIISVALIIGFFAAITYAAAFAARATDSAELGVLTWLGLFFGVLFVNRKLADRSDRRRAASLSIAQSCGEPAHTPDQVRGRLSPDCASAQSQG